MGLHGPPRTAPRLPRCTIAYKNSLMKRIFVHESMAKFISRARQAHQCTPLHLHLHRAGRGIQYSLPCRAHCRTAALHSLCSQDAQVELHVIEGDVVDSEFGRYVVLATYLLTYCYRLRVRQIRSTRYLLTYFTCHRLRGRKERCAPFAVDAVCIITRDAAGVWAPLYTVLACTSGF